MKLINYLILSIISSITNILPLSYYSHITIYQNLFNTKIFNYPELNSLFIISPIIAILITIIKSIHKKELLKKKKYYFKLSLLIFITIIISNIFHLIFINYQTLSIKNIPFILLLLSLLLFLTKNKSNVKNNNELTFKKIIFINLFNLFSLIDGIPIFITNLLSCYICKLNKEYSIKFSFIIYLSSLLIDSSKGFIYLFNSQEIIYILTSIFISTLIALSLIKYLIRLIKNNELYKISIYLIIISIFTLYWFR